MPQTIIDLLHHGDAEGDRLYRGQFDYSLTPLGWQQMQAQMPVDKPWQQLVTSPLKRCAAFAEALTRETGLPLAYDPRLMERGLGDWEGQTAETIKTADKAAFYAFYNDPIRNTPPGAEPLGDFQQRVISAWQDLLWQYQQRHILLITHTGTIRMILSRVLDIPISSMARIDVPDASLSRIEIDGVGSKASSQLKFHAGHL